MSVTHRVPWQFGQDLETSGVREGLDEFRPL